MTLIFVCNRFCKKKLVLTKVKYKCMSTLHKCVSPTRHFVEFNQVWKLGQQAEVHTLLTLLRILFLGRIGSISYVLPIRQNIDILNRDIRVPFGKEIGEQSKRVFYSKSLNVSTMHLKKIFFLIYDIFFLSISSLKKKGRVDIPLNCKKKAKNHFLYSLKDFLLWWK